MEKANPVRRALFADRRNYSSCVWCMAAINTYINETVLTDKGNRCNTLSTNISPFDPQRYTKRWMFAVWNCSRGFVLILGFFFICVYHSYFLINKGCYSFFHISIWTESFMYKKFKHLTRQNRQNSMVIIFLKVLSAQV